MGFLKGFLPVCPQEIAGAVPIPTRKGCILFFFCKVRTLPVEPPVTAASTFNFPPEPSLITFDIATPTSKVAPPGCDVPNKIF